jgi:hypothetical protein
MNTDHIIHNTNQRMECQHCGFSEAIKMPAPIDAILGKMDAFTQAHKGCKRSDYVKGFDAGWDCALSEMEQWVKREAHEPQRNAPVLALLAHLKMQHGRENT